MYLPGVDTVGSRARMSRDACGSPYPQRRQRRASLGAVPVIDPDGNPVSAPAATSARRPMGGPLPAASLAMMPVGSIALVLGYVAGSTNARRTPGRIATLADELKRRGVYADILASLDPELSRRIELLYTADRGQLWATGGRRPG